MTAEDRAARTGAVLGGLAVVGALVAQMPRLLALARNEPIPMTADALPWLAVLVVWERRMRSVARRADLFWALPSDLFRDALLVGGIVVVAMRVTLAITLPGGRPTAIVVATTVEDILYALGILALGALAAFALSRTLLRPVLASVAAPDRTRDISLRTRFVVIASGASFATAGVLLDVLVDFEGTPQGTLLAYLLLAAALVAFASVIGWLVGDDAARGVSSIARRIREVAVAKRDDVSVPLLAADEIGALAVAAMEVERRIGREQARLAATGERDRIARELHDGVAKSVSILALEAGTAASRANDGSRADLLRLQHRARLMSDELRAIVSDLRVRGDPRPFVETLAALNARYPRARLTVEGDVEVIGPLARFETLRIVEEAVVNAERHARARSIDATVAVGGERVAIDIEDDGIGIGQLDWSELLRTNRFGLVGMRERVELLGGTMIVDRRDPRGTRVHVDFPVTA